MQLMPRVQQVFRDVFDDDDLVVAEHTTARDIPDWDSLTHVTLIVALERAFGIRFDAAEISSPANVGELVAIVEAKVAAGR